MLKKGNQITGQTVSCCKTIKPTQETNKTTLKTTLTVELVNPFLTNLHRLSRTPCADRRTKDSWSHRDSGWSCDSWQNFEWLLSFVNEKRRINLTMTRSVVHWTFNLWFDISRLSKLFLAYNYRKSFLPSDIQIVN